MKKHLLKITLFVVFPLFGFSQDNLSHSQSYKDIYLHYQQEMNANLALYNGKEYSGYLFPIDGNVFFINKWFDNGRVDYKNVKYENIQLMYDIVKDELIALEPVNKYNIVLDKNLVSTFSLLGYSFINISTIKIDNKFSAEGYYQVLGTNEENLLLAKRYQTIYDDLQIKYVVKKLREGNSYYIIKDHKIYPLNKLKSIIAAYPLEKGNIKKFKRSQNLNFNKQKEASYKSLFSYLEKTNPK
jgi:hypothetical protein